MNWLTIIISALTLAGLSGGVAAWYRRGQGLASLETAQTLIAMQKEENAMLVRQNTALRAQMDRQDIIIERLTNGTNKNKRT